MAKYNSNITFQSLNGETKVTVKHEGWKGSEEWEQAKEWHVQAWEQVLSSLKSKLESGEGALCCK
ncbi:SRPBCC family protein [Paenibacillus caui]|uniref:SRPBCC family protein n=1 Tax=Paenibacillus caui TaxID=2873927 RepID=UPI001CA862C2|nr:SRPBCC domain-containing protein [Paenibacillus caui]